MTGTSASFLVGPLMAFGVVGILVLLLRWTFRRGSSVVARQARPGTEDDYGLMVAVASPPTYVEGEIMRRTLEDARIRAHARPDPGRAARSWCGRRTPTGPASSSLGAAEP